MQENNLSMPTPNEIDQAQFEADKRAVYKHPLFSLLALLLEKCEQATQGYVPSSSSSSSNSSASSPNGTNNSNAEGDSFSRDIQAFVQLLEKEKRPLLTNNAELDGLMIKALQVLRIHLLELEKVQELCRDFCTRYIACLRGKMQSENLLRSDYPLESNNNLSNSNSPINSPEQDHVTNQSSSYYSNNDYVPSSDVNDFSSLQGAYNMTTTTTNNQITESNYNNSTTTTATAADITSNGNSIPSALSLPSQHHQQQQQHHHPSNNIPAAHQQTLTSTSTIASSGSGGGNGTISSSQILGSTPLSQIGCPPLPLDQYSGQLSPCGSSDDIDSELDSNNDDLSSNFSNNSGSKRQKRGILPKQATSVMRAWLFQHLVHPYPTEDEKRAIAAQTNLTLLQVNNWFINARRRILQPMLEHASDNGANGQARKKPPQSNSPSKRYWPENLSSNGQNNNNLNPALIDPNIENISTNVNRAEIDRLSAQKLNENFYSSDESNDSLVIDQEC